MSETLKQRLSHLADLVRELGDRPTPFTFRSLAEIQAAVDALAIGSCRGGHPHYCPNCDRTFES